MSAGHTHIRFYFSLSDFLLLAFLNLSPTFTVVFDALVLCVIIGLDFL